MAPVKKRKTRKEEADYGLLLVSAVIGSIGNSFLWMISLILLLIGFRKNHREIIAGFAIGIALRAFLMFVIPAMIAA